MPKRPAANEPNPDGQQDDDAQPSPAELAAAMAARRYTARPLKSLVPYARNSRTHSPSQVAMLKGMLMEYGWTRPVALADDIILAGHGITMAALELAEAGKCPPGWPDPWSAPVVDLSHFSTSQRRAYVIADNKAAERAGWDTDMLAMELGDLKEDGFDLSLTGFDQSEMDALLNGWNPDMSKIDKVPADNAALLATLKIKCPQEQVDAVASTIREAIQAAGHEGVEID